MSQSVRIVCLCSGNICRSPMAQAILKHDLEAQAVAAAIISAGVLGLQGYHADEHARTAMRQCGLDIEGHRSQKVSLPLLRIADYLVIMAPRHERAVLELDRSLAPRIVRLWEYASAPLSKPGIPDPIGLELADFVVCRELLQDCITNWIERTFVQEDSHGQRR